MGISSATAAISIDLLCEKYYWFSPYAYCANNPIKFIDLDGLKIVLADKYISLSSDCKLSTITHK